MPVTFWQFPAGGAVPAGAVAATRRTWVDEYTANLNPPTGANQLNQDLGLIFTVPTGGIIVEAFRLWSSIGTAASVAANHYEYEFRTGAGVSLSSVNTTTVGNEMTADTAYPITVDQNLTVLAGNTLLLRVDVFDAGGIGAVGGPIGAVFMGELWYRPIP